MFIISLILLSLFAYAPMAVAGFLLLFVGICYIHPFLRVEMLMRSEKALRIRCSFKFFSTRYFVHVKVNDKEPEVE